MTTKSLIDIQGYEYDWLAMDADGCVAFFNTAGGGSAPDAFLRDTDAHDDAIDAILAMPMSTGTRRIGTIDPRRVDKWRLVAQRGLFAFDADCYGGPYELVAVPDIPVHVTELPETVATVVRGVVLGALRFCEVSRISSDELRACVGEDAPW